MVRACSWAEASVIQLPPSIILGYAIAGFIAFLIMRELGEMVVEEPSQAPLTTSPTNTGPLSPASRPAGTTGYCTSWLPWPADWVGKYFSSGSPKLPTWASAAVFFVTINAINLTNVKVFGK
ncbi:hypothetical protein ACNKHO_00865 [Shigella flexneri]